ncbi:hypothetical protein KKG52_03970 [Patescibacteria group bacterium]|nr:hypothetical protein [Patescibacteria group bacterium]
MDLVKDYSVEIKDAGWLKRSTDWYKDGDLNKPIIYAKDKKEKKELEQIKDSLALGINPKNVKWGGDYVEFKGSVGSAYIIKNTYFPTWRVSGAKGPYLVSPSYIIVIPTQENVKLYFAYGLVDWVGLILSGAGIGYLIFIRKQDQS